MSKASKTIDLSYATLNKDDPLQFMKHGRLIPEQWFFSEILRNKEY